jgi:glycosyltransferase involved in cell wall biosynthesis
MKRISVCMPVYNGGLYLRAQLSSILEQLDESDEIIIADDGSTDNSLAIIAEFGDYRIRVIPGEKSSHPSYNLERALEAASGMYIFLSDQDDVWKPNKVAQMLQALKGSSLVVHDCEVVDQNLAPLHPSFYQSHGSKAGLAQNILRNSYLGCCMAFKAELLKKALPFPRPIGMHDIWLGVVAEMWHKTIFINDNLLYYRRHEKNASTTSNASRLNLWQQLVLRLRLVWQLFTTFFR